MGSRFDRNDISPLISENDAINDPQISYHSHSFSLSLFAKGNGF